MVRSLLYETASPNLQPTTTPQHHNNVGLGLAMSSFPVISCILVFCFICCLYLFCGFDNQSESSVSRRPTRQQPEVVPQLQISSLPVFNLRTLTAANFPHVDTSECAICLSKFEPTDLLCLLPECNHVFHAYCIKAWLVSTANKNNSCPICRAEVKAEADQVESDNDLVVSENVIPTAEVIMQMDEMPPCLCGSSTCRFCYYFHLGTLPDFHHQYHHHYRHISM